jgi:hypothetical protein
MLFAYWTIDEVNQSHAEALAIKAGVQLDVRTFRDPAALGSCEAVLYDLDFFPRDRRQALLADLRAGRYSAPVAVHSYHMSNRHVRALRRRGVIVVRHLRVKVFAALRVAVAARRAKPATAEGAAAAMTSVPAR